MVAWAETTASRCRYGRIAGRLFGDWDVVWEDSEDDYSGRAKIVATKGIDWAYYEWTYGSCSGCDTWESNEYSEDRILMEMVRQTLYMTTPQMAQWLNRLSGGLDALVVGDRLQPASVRRILERRFRPPDVGQQTFTISQAVSRAARQRGIDIDPDMFKDEEDQ